MFAMLVGCCAPSCLDLRKVVVLGSVVGGVVAGICCGGPLHRQYVATWRAGSGRDTHQLRNFGRLAKRRKAQAQNGWATDGRDPQYHIRTHTIVDTH